MRIAFLGNFRVSYTSESHHAATLESLGHTVVRLQEAKATTKQILAAAGSSDLFVWVHTHGWNTPDMDRVLAHLREHHIPSLTYHLDLWLGLKRERDMRRSPYWDLDHFFTVDKLMADWLNSNTNVKGHFLPAGVFDQDCYISDQPSPHANDVVFVGSRTYHREWPWRPQLVDWLANTYKDKFTHIGPDGVGTLRGDELNRMYSHSKVAVGDTLCKNFTYPWYTSDRLFETPGRGGFQVFPRITGVDEWFTDGNTIRFFDFNDFTGLRNLIDQCLADDEARENIRVKAHEHVKAHHTYRNRWQHILEVVGC